GQRYQIILRQGLPSTVEEALLADVALNVYVRDRKPSARFSGSGFVLPASVRRGIPLITINTDKAELKLYRVGQRALAPLLRGSTFLQRLSRWEVSDLTSNMAEEIWNGAIDVRPQLNKEVVTSIPIDEAVGVRKPGVYLMTATPPSALPEQRQEPASQWFVISDIGLTTFGGAEHLTVFARSLASAKPIADVKLTLLARNNQVLGTATTDDHGRARFDAGLTRGKDSLAPAVLTALGAAEDFVFLDVGKPGFDFSDRGVEGRAVPQGIDVYAWTERGIYRAGERVHVAALARDGAANAVRDLPLTFVFKRPDGVEDRRLVGHGEALGGYAVELPLTENAKRGTWRVQVFTDPKQPAVATERFLVEDFLPERTDFTITPAQAELSGGVPTRVSVEGRYLYGAPAAGLTLEGELEVKTTREREGHTGYLFGLAAEEGGARQQFPLEDLAKLDDVGRASFDVALQATRATTRPQTADLVVRLREGSGRAVERRQNLKVRTNSIMLGVRPDFEGGQAGENSQAGFSLIAVAPDGRTAGLAGARWSLTKIERNYQWYRSGSYWRYEPVDLEKKVADGTLDLSADAPERLSVPVEWGRYRLQVESAASDGPVTSVLFNAGWFVEAKSTETPDGLEIGLDKSAYAPGDVAKLKVSPRFAGELLIAIASDQVHETWSVPVPAGGTTVDVAVKQEWGPGAYVLATLHRPGDAGASRMPQRAIGVKWLSVRPEKLALKVSLNPPAQTLPHQPLVIPVKVTGLSVTEEAFVTVAAVDVGILNLTNYQSPDPVKRYFGQRKLGIAMRDLYGKLIDGSLGQTGRLRTGGDGFGGMSAHGSAPTQKLLAFFSGPVRLDENGSAEVSFDIPQFNGTARIIAVAWSQKGVGAAETETLIREPVVVAASLPKVMAPGDTSRLLLEVTNTDAPAGSFGVALESSDHLELAADNLPATIDLAPGEKRTLEVPVTARGSGTGWARIRLTGQNEFSAGQDITAKVRPAVLPVTQKLQVALAENGGSLTVDEALLTGQQMDGAKISISVARPSAFDVPSLLLQLDRYPYGCTEQITSKALPLLYAGAFSSGFPGLEVDGIKEKVQTAINTVLTNQSSAGGFSLWGTQADDLWLSAYVTDFLTRAREKGYEVPEQPLRQALSGLQNTLAYSNNLDENDAAIAYGLYVLARNKVASAGDLRYYADARLQAFRSPLARAQLASAMALYGDQQRAAQTFTSALRLAQQANAPQSKRYTYGSKLRDAAAMLALAVEARPQPSGVAEMTALVKSLSQAGRSTSTQEQAWMLLAARAEEDANRAISLNVDGLSHSGAYARRLEGADLTANPVQITNRSEEALEATVTTLAVPAEPPAPGGTGFTISRNYHRMDGTKQSVGEVAQNERFVVVISVKQVNDVPSRLIITDLLPAGFEIDNPSLVTSAALSNFKWLPNTIPAHKEFRDDRFVAAFDRAKGGETEFTVAYSVRAVTPGRFQHPAAHVEDMYRPELSARTATGWMSVVKR
ncbi:MAG: alpha-2-macroglobulin, partial [Pseudomonadota bacterium]